MDDGTYWVILLIYGSHDMRHTGFRRLTLVNETPGFWGVTDSVSSSSSASSHYSTLFDERLREELQEIQENLHRKNEEIQ